MISMFSRTAMSRSSQRAVSEKAPPLALTSRTETGETMDPVETQTFANYLGVSLWICSTELAPEIITQLVGLQPTHTRLRGSLIPQANVPRRPEFDVHEWKFRKQLNGKPGDFIGQYTEKFISDFLSEIKAHASQI